MLTLTQLLEWFVQQDGIRLMLDIKANNSVAVLPKIFRAMLDVKDDVEFWKPKIIYGLWRLNFYQYGVISGILYGFEIINITFSPTIAKAFLKYSLTLPKGFQLRAISLISLATMAPEFKPLREEVMDPNEVGLYLWTLNTSEDFALAFHQQCSGLITDKPEEAKEAINKLRAGELTAYGDIPYFSYANLRLNLRFGLFRLFEFIIFNNLMRFTLVQRAFIPWVKFVTQGQ